METNQSFITIQGGASRTLAPERTVVDVAFNHTFEDYLEACAALEANQKAVFEVAKQCHLDKESVSTASYSIRKDMTEMRDRNFNYTGEKLLGYSLSQSVSISFGINPKLLTDILNGIIAHNPEAEISVTYALGDDTASIEDELLAEAVADARRQAVAMSVAAGCRLGRVIQMTGDYQRAARLQSIGQFTANASPCYSASAFNEPIEDNPSLITVSRNVTIIWELKE